jgi:hypothetical protein
MTLYARVVVGRTEVSVVGREAAAQATSLFDVWVDGESRGTVRLGPYYSPSIGVDHAGNIAIWAGTGAALSGIGGWKEIDAGYAIHAVYRVASGWCIVSEMSVMTVDNDGARAAQRLHGEVIATSRWNGSVLIVRDFVERDWNVFVNEDTLMLGEFERRASP